MAKVLIKVHVALPDSFHTTLENQAKDRTENGERGTVAFGSDEEILNIVYVVLNWESVRSAKSYWTSPKAKAQMAAWNSVAPPEITVLRESPED